MQSTFCSVVLLQAVGTKRTSQITAILQRVKEKKTNDLAVCNSSLILALSYLTFCTLRILTEPPYYVQKLYSYSVMHESQNLFCLPSIFVGHKDGQSIDL